MEDFELTLFDRLNVIKDTINKYGEENFYISFSGGKDSTVLHYMVDMALPDNKIPRVYINTGIEYFDIVNFVKELQKNDDRIVVVNNTRNIRKVLEEKGYPFKSKEHSVKVDAYQRFGVLPYVERYLKGVVVNGKENKFKCPESLKYQFTNRGGELKISDRCCHDIKKHTAHKFQKDSGRTVTITAIRMFEGGNRQNRKGCVVFDRKGKLKSFKPLNPVSNEFMDWFIEKHNVKLCRLYYPPFNFKRTGCKGCPFAIDLQDELETMELYLPNERKQCELLWKPVYDEYRRIGYRLKKNENLKLF